MTLCPECNGVVNIGDWPFCGGDPTKHVPANLATHGDDIPGGQLVPHAICNPDGTPKRYYSKREIRETARKKGWAIDGETPKAALRREV